MTYPIRVPPDNDPAYVWTPEIRKTITGVNDHQNRLNTLEAIPVYTDEKAQDASALLFTTGVHSGISFAYNDATGRIDATVTGGGSSYTTEQAQDDAAALFTAGGHTGISFVYNDATNRVEATVTSAEGANYTGTKTITGKLGVNATPSVKQPINMLTAHDGATVTGSQDKVGFAFGPSLTGNFSADTGSNAGFWWGMNLFATTSTAAGAGAGLTDIIGALIEMSIQTPAGTTLPHVIGLQAEAAFFGASSGCTVTQMESMRVSAPKRKDGSSSGVATNVYGLFIESVAAYNVGTTGSRFSLFVEGGISRFQGDVTVDNVLQSHNGTLTLKGDYSGTGIIQLTTNGMAFFGVPAVGRQSLPASGTVTAANIRQALINLGLCV